MKRILTIAAIVTTSISLAACGLSREEARNLDNDNCASMGLKFGTPEFAQCRLLQDQRRDSANAASAAATQRALQNFNNTVQNNTVDTSKFNTPMQPIGPQRVDVYTRRGF